jgi:hypothetical protein
MSPESFTTGDCTKVMLQAISLLPGEKANFSRRMESTISVGAWFQCALSSIEVK